MTKLKNSRFFQFLLTLCVALVLGTMKAHAAFVALDSTTGEVTFTPGDVLTTVKEAIVAALIAGVSIFVLFKGARWVYKALTVAK